MERDIEKFSRAVAENYFEDLRLDKENLRDKKILDIGSRESLFAKWAKDQGVSTEVYNLDLHDNFLQRQKSVQGAAEKLPFLDESFDLIVSHAAVPNEFVLDIYPRKRTTESINDMLRALKVNGEIRLGPLGRLGDDKYPHYKIYQALKKRLTELQNQGKIEFRLVPLETYELDHRI